jgi:putative FmdB family regulatory protein
VPVGRAVATTVATLSDPETTRVPTYQYRCTACDHAFEQFQSFTDDALTVCPECGGRLRKVFNAVGVVFKGSGFYRTDSRSTSTASASGGGSTASSGSGDSASSSTSSSGSSSDGSSSSSSDGSSSGSTPKPSSSPKSSSPSSAGSSTSGG